MCSVYNPLPAEGKAQGLSPNEGPFRLDDEQSYASVACGEASSLPQDCGRASRYDREPRIANSRGTSRPA